MSFMVFISQQVILVWRSQTEHMGRVCSVYWEEGNCMQILVWKHKRKRPLYRTRRTWDGNFKTELQDVRLNSVVSSYVPHDRQKLRAFVDTVMKFRAPRNANNSDCIVNQYVVSSISQFFFRFYVSLFSGHRAFTWVLSAIKINELDVFSSSGKELPIQLCRENLISALRRLESLIADDGKKVQFPKSCS